MSYTKRDFASELKQQLGTDYNVVKVARWAFEEYLSHCNDLEPGLKTEMMKVITMEEGPEFEMTAQEIQELANNLEKSR